MRRFCIYFVSTLLVILVTVACSPTYVSIGPSIIKEKIPEGGYTEIVLSGHPESIDSLSQLYDLTLLDSCACDNNIYLFEGPSDFEIEDVLTSRRKGDPKGGKNIEFTIPFIEPEIQEKGGSPIPTTFYGPIVAILDTGLDYQKFESNEISLLSNDGLIDPYCFMQKRVHNFGYNFIDNDSDLHDPIKHGTYVTKTLAKHLDNPENFRILPLKVFNNKGEGQYWDIVCAFSYLDKLIEKGLDIAVVNASFGFTLNQNPEGIQDSRDDIKDFDILKEYIDKWSESTVVVTSAGNEKLNNDQNPHFPSSYIDARIYSDSISPSTNLFAVAGYSGKDGNSLGVTINNKYGSNFGEISVNIAGPWKFNFQEKIFDVNRRIRSNYFLEGTSYSAPFISAKLLNYMSTESPPLRGTELLENFLANQNTVHISRNLPIKNGKYVKE